MEVTTMDIKKLAPWNWFKEEETQNKSVPISTTGQNYVSPLSQLHQEIDRIFDNVLRSVGISNLDIDKTLPHSTQNLLLKPCVDIAATDKEYTITVEVPGVEEDHIKLELTNDTLIIKGEKKHESEKKDKNIYRVERAYGAFQRVLSLPEDANQEDIKAQIKNGVLTITMPRKEVSKPKGKLIDIKKAS
ncbi:TPA: Hsp20/alpha crystallin family protein [Legionella pneumophila]|nr:Hsp20 family protein [Legionella pneumophila]HAU1576323.1 Hsp20/alpha crystallin family protein [Legionella pneumophila]HAU1680141.1 Hsp20/alpha crystallin family protein [Legionella pneumophila]HAU3700384.1 Hsp20/alpha crystallin family protein [Legionella pneumophila]